MTVGDFIDRLFKNLPWEETAADDPIEPYFKEDWPTAVASFGPEIIPVLMRHARKGRKHRKMAILTLGRLGDRAAETAPYLVKVLKEKHPVSFEQERPCKEHGGAPSPEAQQAEIALRAIKPVAVLPQLIRILTHGPAYSRMLAANVCGAIGPAAHEALPALRNCVTLDPYYRRKYQEAIAKIDKEDRAPRK